MADDRRVREDHFERHNAKATGNRSGGYVFKMLGLLVGIEVVVAVVAGVLKVVHKPRESPPKANGRRGE